MVMKHPTLMKPNNWKETLRNDIETSLAHDIDIFEGQMELMISGNLDKKVFAETRLRRGVYGQRYDNGLRHDGFGTRTLNYQPDRFKGPDTVWDAPGMQRIKIPFGGLTPDQLDVLAQVADDYSDGILHVTTRQDFQLHYVHIEDTPDMMRRLGAVGITTQEACGNVVRNVTSCSLSGVCRTEAFDTTPYAHALTQFLLGHDDAQDFGRKIKIAFSGCAGTACGLVMIHDLGFVAQVKDVDGIPKRGFSFYVGGGLGAVPHQAQLFDEFMPAEEILPIAQAICRVFARLGEKRNRNRARLKFLVAKLGIDEFRRKVLDERAILPHDDEWVAYLAGVPSYQEDALNGPTLLRLDVLPEGFDDWFATNVYRQRQDGYCVATVHLPLGDLTGRQAIELADIARKYVGDNLRTTVEQNIVLRWVTEADLPALYGDLKAIGLGVPGAGSIVDITACPGTDTCKLGIASSRGLAGELLTRLTLKSASLPDAVKDLKIKISGCFNSCGQHHVSDLGFYGNSRKAGNHKVPHFQVVLGGQWERNAGSYGLAIGAVPSKAVPDVVDAITERYVRERERGERFQDWTSRLGKKEAREMIRPFMKIPAYETDPTYYSDWGDHREFTLGDLGKGECAGEIVSLFSMEISKAESENFEAQLALEEGDFERADRLAYHSMLLAARTLIRTQYPDVSDEPDEVVAEFRKRFYDTKLFFDKYAKGKFANYFFDRHNSDASREGRSARRVVEEAQLFIEAAHACDMRINIVEEPIRAKAVPSDKKPKLPPSRKLPPGRPDAEAGGILKRSKP